MKIKDNVTIEMLKELNFIPIYNKYSGKIEEMEGEFNELIIHLKTRFIGINSVHQEFMDLQEFLKDYYKLAKKDFIEID